MSGFERKAIIKMREWRGYGNHKALLVRGMRQVGKTFLIKRFAESDYKSFIYVNLEREKSVREIFETGDRTFESIVERLQFETRVKLYGGRSAIILDEIQFCPEAFSSLKALAEPGIYDIIASGSLLGILLGSGDDGEGLSPVGYVNILDMYPMDFEEWLWARGFEKRHTEYIRGCISEGKEIDPQVNRMMSDEYRRYLAVGGMPDAVRMFVETRDYARVIQVQRDILSLVSADVRKYSSPSDAIKIMDCLESLPSQIGSDHPRFMYSKVSKKKGGSSRKYGSALQWLISSGIAVRCGNLTQPAAPLSMHRKKGEFKIYLCDTGILVAMSGPGLAGELVSRDAYANNGAVMENAAACALSALGYDLYYYKRTDSKLEIDFLMWDRDCVTAVEVDGRNTKAKSLYQIYAAEKRVGRAVKLSENNVFRDVNGIENYPLYALAFFPEAFRPMADATDIEEMMGRIDSASGSGRSADFHPDEIQHLFGRYPADYHVLRHRFRRLF